MIEIMYFIALYYLLFVIADKAIATAIDATTNIRKFLTGVVAYRAVTGRWPTRFTMKCWWTGVTNEEWLATLHEEQVIAHLQ
jgi:hypothetical protein